MARHAAPPTPGRWRTVLQAAGEVVVTCGLVVLLFVVYELVVTDLFADRAQADLTEEIRTEWDGVGEPMAPGEEVPGDALAVLHVPRLGEDYRRVVLEGTTEAQLSQGPGHYPDTALPGQAGNFAMAGHRIGKGSPFEYLDTMLPGDPIVVETADTWYVYRVLGDPVSGEFSEDVNGVTGRQIVRPEDVQVISPTPNASADEAATGSYLTLTTCHPRYSAAQRLIIHAALEGSGTPKSELPDGPSALHES
jgi:sortase (surface protein transpeptidase)